MRGELKVEHDLRGLRLSRAGTGRRKFGGLVRLEPDAAAAVNEALRFLIRITKEDRPTPARERRRPVKARVRAAASPPPQFP